MLILKHQANDWIDGKILWESLAVDFASKQILTAIGAGGKTSALACLARELSGLGKKVILTTSTHMMMPDSTSILTEDLDVIHRRLENEHFALVGRPASNDKMTGVPESLYLEICSLADVVLVEADGSRQLPLKLPAKHEPVIPGNTTHVLVLAGLSAIGQRIRNACHRDELVMKLLKTNGDHQLTSKDLVEVIRLGYWLPFVEDLNLSGTVILNQADHADHLVSAKQIAAQLSPVPCLITQLRAPDRAGVTR